MIGEIDSFMGEAQDSLYFAFVIFLRVGTAMAVLPAFGEQSIPARMRLFIAFAFTAIVTPALMDPWFDQSPNLTFGLFNEVVAGLFIGLSLRLFVIALQTAGAIAAQSVSLSQIFGLQGEPTPAIGHLFLISGLALAVMMGLHVRLAEFLIMSYDFWPLGQLPTAAGAVTDWGVSQVVDAFSLAFVIACPFLLASLIYNVALGFINRAMPQLMVAFVGAPAITLGGLLLLVITTPVLLAVWVSHFNQFLGNASGTF